MLSAGTNLVEVDLILGDIKLSFYGIDIVVLLVFAVSVFIQSGAEEPLFSMILI